MVFCSSNEVAIMKVRGGGRAGHQRREAIRRLKTQQKKEKKRERHPRITLQSQNVVVSEPRETSSIYALHILFCGEQHWYNAIRGVTQDFDVTYMAPLDSIPDELYAVPLDLLVVDCQDSPRDFLELIVDDAHQKGIKICLSYPLHKDITPLFPYKDAMFSYSKSSEFKSYLQRMRKDKDLYKKDSSLS